MIDYNDGNWHGWNGGECPVHPESVIDLKWMTRDGLFGVDHERIASNYNWPTPCLFRVTKPYVEPPKPREFWVNEYDWGFDGVVESKAEADELADKSRIRCIHVREVIEE